MADLSPSPPEEPPSSLPLPEPLQKRRIAIAAGLSLLWCAFALLAQISGALDAFEEPLLDWRQSLSAYPAPPSNDLALVAIDAIPPDRPWPWSRLDYSLVLRSLITYAPASVVFEMNLNDHDTDSSSLDDTFSHIVQRADDVIFAATVMTPKNPTSLPATITSLPTRGGLRAMPRYGSVLWPLDTFASASEVGAHNLSSEAGLRLRRAPMVFLVNDKVIPSLVLQAVTRFLGGDLASSEVQLGRAIFIRRKDGKLLRTVPIDEEGRMRIRFHPGPAASWQASFDNVLLSDDQLQHGTAPESDLRVLAKRQVWIGRTDAGERERFVTAVGPLSRVEAELQAERNILEQDYVRPLPPMILAALYVLIAISGAASLIRFGPIHAAIHLIILSAFWFESSLLVFRVYNVILPLPSFAMLIVGTFAVGLLASHWDVESEGDEETEE